MNRKIIALCGISGSGKSTYAHQLVKENPSKYVLVNRDKIRELLFGYTEESIAEYYQRTDLSKLEKQVTLYEDTLIHEGLNLGKIVIVDSTNLTKAYLKRYEFWNVPIEYKYFDVDFTFAVNRDMQRIRQVGRDVIVKQYDKYLALQREGVPTYFEPVEFIQDKNKPSIWVFDIDNTIAHKGSRSAYDWKAVGEDELDESIANLFRIIDTCDHVIFCSGRDEICRKETEDWLRNKLGNYHIYNLLMRPKGDQRPDWIVKEELWREIAKEYYIEALVDDRNAVIRRARALGLKVMQVEYGNF